MTWLERYREYEAKATPGPWTLEDCNSGGKILIRECLQTHLQVVPTADADLIVHIRNSAPALAALVEACRGHGDAPGHCEICAALTALDRDAAGGGE